jgi:predicted TIM-barrel fold metal-dependent hydrolase
MTVGERSNRGEKDVYHVVSADSHLELPPDRFTHRVPEKYRDRAPRRIQLADGGEAMTVENRPLVLPGLSLSGGPPEALWPVARCWDTGNGAGSPEQRMREQDEDGIEAEILFPGLSGPNFWRGIRDDQAYLAVVHAYNEFLAEDYCAVNPDRLLGLGVIPEVSVESAIAELEYCARAGLPGIVLNAFPSGKMMPTAEDDRFWSAALDLDMPVTIHVGFRSGGTLIGRDYPGLLFEYERQVPDAPQGTGNEVKLFMRYALAGGGTATLFVFGGVFDRFPNLHVYFAENNLGWIPMWLEGMDDIYHKNHLWIEKLVGMKPLARKPSEYVLEHCYWGFQNNPVGVQMRHMLNVERLMWANDFPHAETDWPFSREVIKNSFQGVPEDEKHKMLAGNFMRFFKRT